jgi:IclR family transcriptional regulator, acetate operon repressor
LTHDDQAMTVHMVRHVKERSTSAVVSGAQVLEKSLDVLDIVAEAGPIGRSEIISRTGIPRATAARILAVLTARGMVGRESTGRRYILGPRMYDIADHASIPSGLASEAAIELRRLRDVTGETAYFAVRDGNEVVSISKYEGPHEIRSASTTGQRKHIHCTSQGKAILSALSSAERQSLVAGLKLRKITSHTIVDPHRLMVELDIAAERGFALDDEENILGIRCVGAPVVDATGNVLGAISIAGPHWRLSIERLEKLGKEVAMSASTLGAQFRPERGGAGGAPIVALPLPVTSRGLSPRWEEEGLWVADAREGHVSFIDLEHHDRSVFAAERQIAGLELTQDQGAIVIEENGNATLIDQQGQNYRSHRLTLPAGGEVVTTAVHPSGQLWISIRNRGVSQLGAVANGGLIDIHLSIERDVIALAWSADGSYLFLACAGGSIHRWSYHVRTTQLLITLPNGSGIPSSMASDASGLLWVALKGGWALARLNEIGEVDHFLPLPVPAPSGIAFGGKNFDTLFIATALESYTQNLQVAPLSGRFLSIMVPFAGLPPARMTGIKW